jgi:hypothetical protein
MEGYSENDVFRPRIPEALKGTVFKGVGTKLNDDYIKALFQRENPEFREPTPEELLDDEMTSRPEGAEDLKTLRQEEARVALENFEKELSQTEGFTNFDAQRGVFERYMPWSINANQLEYLKRKHGPVRNDLLKGE